MHTNVHLWNNNRLKRLKTRLKRSLLLCIVLYRIETSINVPTICNHYNFIFISILIYLQFWTTSKYIFIACLHILLFCIDYYFIDKQIIYRYFFYTVFIFI